MRIFSLWGLLLLSFCICSCNKNQQIIPDGNGRFIIWTGETEMPADLSVWEKIDASAFVDINVSDNIVITAINIAKDDFSQVYLRNGNNSDLCGAGNILLYGDSVESVLYGVTPNMLKDIKSNGVCVGGVGFTLSKVTIVKNANNGDENSIWLGRREMPMGWESNVYISAASFKNIEAGDTIAFVATDVMPEASVRFLTEAWTDVPDMIGYYDIDGNELSLIVTELMLNEINKNGLIILGSGFTLTQVRLVK